MTVAQANPQHEELARWVWTLGIVGFFALQAILWLVAITLTLRDPSFAVAPQYEQQAEQWDALMAKRRASEALGWTMQFVAGASEPSGESQLRIRLVDRAGNPVDGADFQLRLFHCARADEVQNPNVCSVGNGWYVATAHLSRSGVWKLVGCVEHRTEAFYFDRKERFDVSGSTR
jgi:nitrogen fixation protein FixH